jgi:Major Facilitator Superfamily
LNRFILFFRESAALRDLDTVPGARRTYRCHWWYSVLSGVNAGILTNAPTIAIKSLHAPDWQLAFPTGLSGFGLLISLMLGIWMARRPKLPFVLLPGFISCAVGLSMVASNHSLWFLVMLGLCNLFETMTRPAITSIIRSNYPVDTRGEITGRLRQQSAATFLGSSFAIGWLLDYAGSWKVIQSVIALAAVVQACAYVIFSLIRVRTDFRDQAEEDQTEWRTSVRNVASTLGRDSRFLRYLFGCFIYGVGALIYEPIIRAYFSKDLHLNYRQCVVLVDVLPSICSVLTLRHLGAWIDRNNPLIAWAVIRISWGLDPLLLALAPAWPAEALGIAVVARIFRGMVMNGSWILWWQLGTNYFAGRTELTPVYVGLHISLNGVQRICGPPLGAGLSSFLPRRGILAIGAFLVLIAAYLAWRQARAEKVDGQYPTFADKESADLAAKSAN